MKRMLAIVCLLVPMFAVMPGCSLFQATSTPAIFDPARPMQDRVVSAERIYTATLKQLTMLRQEGFIDDSAQNTIAELRKKASLALDSAHLYADAGDKGNFDAQINAVQGILNELTLSLAKAQNKKGT